MKKIDSNNYQIDKLSLNKIRKDFVSESLNEKETLDIIKEIYNNNKIIIDPHTAVGLGVAKKLNIKKNCVVLSTAHPCKFPTTVTKAINIKSELPVELHYILNEKENFDVIKNNVEEVKKYILSKLN